MAIPNRKYHPLTLLTISQLFKTSRVLSYAAYAIMSYNVGYLISTYFEVMIKVAKVHKSKNYILVALPSYYLYHEYKNTRLVFSHYIDY